MSQKKGQVLKAVQYDERSEPRSVYNDYTFIRFSFADNPDISIKVLAVDKSTSGLGCHYIGPESLCEGQEFLHKNGKTYVIKNIERIRGNSYALGLSSKVVREENPVQLNIEALDPFEDEVMEEIKGIITSYKTDRESLERINLYTIDENTEELQYLQFNGPSIIICGDKMKKYLPYLKSLSNRFALITLNQKNWQDSIHHTMRAFLQNQPYRFEEQTKLCDSLARLDIFDHLEKQYPDLSSRDQGKLISLLDEVLINAFYDAPTDDRGMHIFSLADRNEEIVLDEHKAVYESHTLDEKMFWFSVKDAYGSFPPEVLLKNLKKGLFGKKVDADDEEEESGLGLYSMWRNSHSLFFNIQSGKMTNVTGCTSMSAQKKNSVQNCLVLSID